ncbi:class I SAM-dependent methyltransferase [Dermatobacter hominis]|uniref:class I SAM-dependent methyltransferase n=1 Tax=Dermatobacter hominis TaxID=2884263 RepID=UPI001D124845|nr:methyltransferase domain-containing protein [Dermatobacter hominis]UDY37144.1 class I SAM-dependent methyltransferase [Dermatobacter hominis]
MEPVPDPTFDAGTYGRSFADVYDSWYPADATTTGAVEEVARLAGPGGGVLELGVGTGRLALPLAERGFAVTGIDAAAPMLDQLSAKDPEAQVVRALADVGAPDGTEAFAPWPDGPFDVVLAACNLICNLTDARAQADCIAGAAARLRPGGHLVVEAFVPAPLTAGPQLAASEVRADAVVLIATDADPETGVVVGQHVELRDGVPARLRPWRIRVAAPEEIDAWAAAAGLELVARRETWGPDGPPSDGLVSTYRRP